MPPFAILGLIAGAFSAVGAVQAGQERKRQANQAAYDTQIEREQASIQALQEHNNRLRDYNEIESISLSWLSYAGRIEDQSFKAATKRSKKALLRDTSNISSASLIRDYRFKAKESEYKRSGRYAELAGYTTGFSTLLNSAYAYTKTR